MQSLRHVMTKIVELSMYERFSKISTFLMDIEEKVSEPQRLLALEEALKATPMRWWETHKKTITGWAYC